MVLCTTGVAVETAPVEPAGRREAPALSGKVLLPAEAPSLPARLLDMGPDFVSGIHGKGEGITDADYEILVEVEVEAHVRSHGGGQTMLALLCRIAVEEKLKL